MAWVCSTSLPLTTAPCSDCFRLGRAALAVQEVGVDDQRVDHENHVPPRQRAVVVQRRTLERNGLEMVELPTAVDAIGPQAGLVHRAAGPPVDADGGLPRVMHTLQ